MESVLRRLARDHWVRLHGTPRVTVLVGGAARRAWEQWAGIAAPDAVLLDGVDQIARAVELAVGDPARDVAVAAAREAIDRWRPAAADRLCAMVDEGLLAVESVSVFEPRSAAEATLFEALEATPATAGRFELNGRLSVRFGPDAAEVDLLARADGIAIEIDGVHHFGDPERYRRDRRKDVLLQTRGLFVIRLLAEDVMRDARAGVAVVCQALASRMGDRT